MPERTRGAPAAFGRGVSQVVANPGLLLAPLAFGAAVGAAIGAGALALGAGAAAFLARRVAALRRGPEGFEDVLESLRGLVLASPFAVLLALLGILLLLLLLTAFAAWVRAGLTGALAEADARAPEGARLEAFRHPAPGRAFFRSAGRHFGGFFALVNLYGLVATFLAAGLLAPLAVAVAAAFAQRTLLLGAAVLCFIAGLVVAVAGGAALRVAYLAAGRVLAVEGVDALTAAARAVALVKESPGRAATLYLLTIAGAMAVGLAFVLPRVLLTFAAGAARGGTWIVLGVTAFFVLLQSAAALAYEAIVTGSYVALWPQEAPEPAGAPAPAPVTPA